MRTFTIIILLNLHAISLIALGCSNNHSLNLTGPCGSGQRDYLYIDSAQSLPQGDADFTIEFWFKTSSPSQHTTFVCIGGVDSLGPLNNSCFGAKLTNNQYWWWQHNNDNYFGTVPDNQWTHFAVAKQASSYTFYQNGVVSNYGNNNIDLQGLRIAVGNGWDNCDFNGMIDELKIYKTYRTGSVISNEMYSIPDLSDSNLIGYYNFNSPNIGNDLSLENNNLISKGGNLSGSVDVPFQNYTNGSAIVFEPSDQNSNIGSTVQFILASSDSTVLFVWQQDAGVGFIDLSNAGPYTGVNNDTLVITGVLSSMNNYHFRCIVTSGVCSDTSVIVALTVVTGINELDLSNIQLFPNPTHDMITIQTRGKWQTLLIMYDIFGKELNRWNLEEGTDKKEISLAEFKPAIYYISLLSERFTQTIKVVKE